MKKLIPVISFVLLSTSVFAQPMPVRINGMWFALDNRTMTAMLYMTRKKEIIGDITIPASIVWQHNDYKVRSVRPQAFMGCSELKSIVVSQGIDSVCEMAFSFCKNLESVTILGNPVIGQELFFSSKKVKELNVREGTKLFGISDNVRINYFTDNPIVQTKEPKHNETIVSKPNPTIIQPDGKSDIDTSIPIGKQNNDHTFAVIIANENYRNVAHVPYALNDGYVFSQYCERTFGIPKQNIKYIADATLNDIRIQINWLKEIISAYQGNVKIVFYYAGHGIPDESAKSAFLLPIDGIGSDASTGYALDELYNNLGNVETQAKPQIVVLLDACFSGSTRENEMLALARGVAIKVKRGNPVGNMVVLTAATNDETAYPNDALHHGMFTYYLLKKIKETAGNVTIQELSEYVTTNVRQQSIVLNGKSQTPTLIASPTAIDWQQWKIK